MVNSVINDEFHQQGIEKLPYPIPSVTPLNYPLTSTLLETNDPHVIQAINYAHKEYLSKRYLGPLKNPNEPTEGRMPPNEGSDRGHHGLAHTLRTMSCAEIMIEEARKAQFRGEQLGRSKDGRSLADVTPQELKKILIAQAFFVVGRDDERTGYDANYKRNFYDEYHEKSEQSFRKYVEKQGLIGDVFDNQTDVNTYAAIIRDKKDEKGFPVWNDTPAHVLINQAHEYDIPFHSTSPYAPPVKLGVKWEAL